MNLLKLDLRIFRRVRLALAWRTEPVIPLYEIAKVLYSGTDDHFLFRGFQRLAGGFHQAAFRRWNGVHLSACLRAVPFEIV